MFKLTKRVLTPDEYNREFLLTIISSPDTTTKHKTRKILHSSIVFTNRRFEDFGFGIDTKELRQLLIGNSCSTITSSPDTTNEKTILNSFIVSTNGRFVPTP
ncbi:hypothetical protein CEXT_77281 [Caerostris extrusa]|uniref:Uncharacterized protein n=1 Tax=Caerostris extrusa TaxID=172846 RepID=A0AAV4UAL6_CAEEX|nr:hypothetical protein CEXT_77281 [Caerostris extrusa]